MNMLKTIYCTITTFTIISILYSCSTQKAGFHEGALIGDERVSQYAGSCTITAASELLTNKLQEPAIDLLSDKPAVRLENTFIRYAIDDTTKKADTIKEPEPKLQPLIPAGDAIFALGVGAVAVSVLSGGLSIFIGIGAILLGLCLTSIGYKKVKKEPKKWKGEKLALALYYALIPVGLFLMLYPVYLLFIL